MLGAECGLLGSQKYSEQWTVGRPFPAPSLTVSLSASWINLKYVFLSRSSFLWRWDAERKLASKGEDGPGSVAEAITDRRWSLWTAVRRGSKRLASARTSVYFASQFPRTGILFCRCPTERQLTTMCRSSLTRRHCEEEPAVPRRLISPEVHLGIRR